MKAVRILSAFVALLMVLTLVPAAMAAVGTDALRDAPEGYDEYEFTKMSAFLAIEDEDGVTNAAKLGDGVDPEDPTTWGYDIDWMDGHVWMISFPNKNLVGDLDVSGFTILNMLYCAKNNLTSVDASNCPEMTNLDCSECPTLTALNVTGSSLIQELTCNMCAIESLDLSDDHSAIDFGLDVSDNNLSFLDVSGCTSIPYLDCSNNNLTVLDVSECASLTQIGCFDNPLKEIKVNADVFGFESITAVGNGTVACFDYVSDERPDLWHIATPDEGADFIGWFDEEGTLLSDEADWMSSTDEPLPLNTIAKFTEPEPETHTVVFKDWDGTVLSTQEVVDGEDAVAPEDPEREGYLFTGWSADFTNVTEDLEVVAQYEELPPEGTLLGDVNCDGTVDTTDALLALRYNMGTIQLSAQGLINGDMNGDNVVDSTDAILIMRYLMEN